MMRMLVKNTVYPMIRQNGKSMSELFAVFDIPVVIKPISIIEKENDEDVEE